MGTAFLGGHGLGVRVVIHAIPGAVLLGVLCVTFNIGSFIAAPGTGIIVGSVSGSLGNAQVLPRQWPGSVRRAPSLPGVRPPVPRRVRGAGQDG
jgi:hypothetical protein